MLKPYAKPNLTSAERIFNYRLSRARRIIENSFGILGAKWRIYRTAINASLYLTEKIVTSTLCLHNWLRNHTENSYIDNNLVDTDEKGTLTQDKWRSKQIAFQPISSNSYNSSTTAKETREKFKRYFVGSGAVDWQNDLLCSNSI